MFIFRAVFVTRRATLTPAGALTATSGHTGKCIGLSQVQTVQSSRQPASLLCLTPWPNLSICTTNTGNTLFSQTHCGPLISHHRADLLLLNIHGCGSFVTNFITKCLNAEDSLSLSLSHLFSSEMFQMERGMPLCRRSILLNRCSKW